MAAWASLQSPDSEGVPFDNPYPRYSTINILHLRLEYNPAALCNLSHCIKTSAKQQMKGITTNSKDVQTDGPYYQRCHEKTQV